MPKTGKSAGESARDSSPQGFQQQLLQKVEKISFAPVIREVAERLRRETIAEIEQMDGKCVDKQSLVGSLEVVKGERPNEYMLISKGDYGTKIEFGTRKTTESSFLLPAFAKVKGSIRNCLQEAINKALLKARQLRPR